MQAELAALQGHLLYARVRRAGAALAGPEVSGWAVRPADPRWSVDGQPLVTVKVRDTASVGSGQVDQGATARGTVSRATRSSVRGARLGFIGGIPALGARSKLPGLPRHAQPSHHDCFRPLYTTHCRGRMFHGGLIDHRESGAMVGRG